MIVDRARLETLLGFRVNDPSLYQHAFVHKSAVRLCEEHGMPAESYELFEFLGDAAINLVVSKLVFDLAKARGKREGWATKMRTRLVSGQCLSRLARALGLQHLVMMNPKAISNGWNNNDRILEDFFEALVGCIYLDMSLAAARAFVLTTISRTTLTWTRSSFSWHLLKSVAYWYAKKAAAASSTTKSQLARAYLESGADKAMTQLTLEMLLSAFDQGGDGRDQRQQQQQQQNQVQDEDEEWVEHGFGAAEDHGGRSRSSRAVEVPTVGLTESVGME
eukprot:gene2834-3127_t